MTTVATLGHRCLKKKKKGKEKTNKLALSEIGTECQTQWSKWLLLTELASHPI